MSFENRIMQTINRSKWLIPANFIFGILMLVTGIVLLMVRGIDNLTMMGGFGVFNVAADLACMAIGIAISFSTLSTWRQAGAYNRTFILLIVIGMFSLFLDEMKALVNGIPSLSLLNVIVNVLAFANSVVFVHTFWIYAIFALDLEGKKMMLIDVIMNASATILALLPFVNFFFPLYFSVDPSTGLYARVPGWSLLSLLYSVISLVAILLAVIFSKASLKSKLIIATFISIPALTLALTRFQEGLTTHYIGMFVSIVLIYSVLFTENERKLSSTAQELQLATAIQTSMLPNIFPAFPGKKEFDIYATMDPAKEVGGDFYDFFLIDESHLALVMADVSGKGVPAALFMMATKIMIDNIVSFGASPAMALEKANAQICSNNAAEMFVTVWLGVLDLKTGELKAANAGHEYPILKKADGHFEIVKDQHGFVVGGFDGSRYKEYTLQMEKGAKLFVYTDGVVEAQNKDKTQYGMDRLVKALRKNEEKTSQEIVENVHADIVDFAAGISQFDDITALCVTYNGAE